MSFRDYISLLLRRYRTVSPELRKFFRRNDRQAVREDLKFQVKRAVDFVLLDDVACNSCHHKSVHKPHCPRRYN